METKMQGPPMRGNWGAIRDLKGAPRLREFGLFQFFGRLHLVTLHNATCSRVVNYNNTRTRWITIEWILGDTCERPRGGGRQYIASLCVLIKLKRRQPGALRGSPSISAQHQSTTLALKFLDPKIFWVQGGLKFSFWPWAICVQDSQSWQSKKIFFFVDCFPKSLKTILTHESLIMTRPSFAFYIKIRQWVELYIRFGNY